MIEGAVVTQLQCLVVTVDGCVQLLLLLVPFLAPSGGFQLVLPPTIDDGHHRHVRLWFFVLSVRAFGAFEYDDIIISGSLRSFRVF